VTVYDQVDGYVCLMTVMTVSSETKSIFSNGSAHVLDFYTKNIPIGQDSSRDI
jgi:hypothetical protein